MDVQVIGPQNVEVLQIKGIETSKKVIKIPIPKEVEKNGGSFEIDLGMHCLLFFFWRDFRMLIVSVSVEDASKCKRPISVSGVVVNVRRVVVSEKLFSIIIEFNCNSEN